MWSAGLRPSKPGGSVQSSITRIVAMAMRVCSFLSVGVHKPMGVRAQPSTFFLRQGLIVLELRQVAKLASLCDPGVCLCLPPSQHVWNYEAHSTTPNAYCYVWGLNLGH